MPDAVIDNPILNSPFRAPTRHFRFGDEGITSEVVEERRESAYFMPIPAAKKKSQIHFDTEWTRDRIEENRFINRVRGRVDLWRRELRRSWHRRRLSDLAADSDPLYAVACVATRMTSSSPEASASKSPAISRRGAFFRTRLGEAVLETRARSSTSGQPPNSWSACTRGCRRIPTG